ncbi:MAG: DUF4214 domain-containing protein, partial [Pirellulales bacterium]
FELWQSDGTAAGTSLLADLNPGASSSNPAFLTPVGNQLLMAANDGTHGVSLYAAAIPAAKPTVADNSYNFTAGQTLTVAAPGVLSGATSAAGTTLTATLVSGPSHGTLTLNADGSFTYTPAAGFDGKDSFTINASDGTNTATRPATITVESLDYRWLTNLYTDVLGRPAGDETDSEINFWLGQLASGLTRLQVAEIFSHSGEYYSRLVNGYYEQILQHPADFGGLTYFVGELLAGVSESTVVSQIVSSSEFMSLSGTVNGYVSNLYNVLLGRLPSASEFNYWVTLINGGMTPLTAAEEFTSSSEYQSDLTQSLYEQYLNRPADSTALQDWLWAIQHGATPQSITAALVSSDEFYNG